MRTWSAARPRARRGRGSGAPRRPRHDRREADERYRRRGDEQAGARRERADEHAAEQEARAGRQDRDRFEQRGDIALGVARRSAAKATLPATVPAPQAVSSNP
jgi:hypothetical protein